jgi:hypothetical protein
MAVAPLSFSKPKLLLGDEQAGGPRGDRRVELLSKIKRGVSLHRGERGEQEQAAIRHC